MLDRNQEALVSLGVGGKGSGKRWGISLALGSWVDASRGGAETVGVGKEDMGPHIALRGVLARWAVRVQSWPRALHQWVYRKLMWQVPGATARVHQFGVQEYPILQAVLKVGSGVEECPPQSVAVSPAAAVQRHKRVQPLLVEEEEEDDHRDAAEGSTDCLTAECHDEEEGRHPGSLVMLMGSDPEVQQDRIGRGLKTRSLEDRCRDFLRWVVFRNARPRFGTWMTRAVLRSLSVP